MCFVKCGKEREGKVIANQVIHSKKIIFKIHIVAITTATTSEMKM